MNLDTWLSFVAASLILCFTPGPTLLMVMAQALAHGKTSMWPLVLGTLSGDVMAMGFSLLGMGAILAASPMGFKLLTWCAAGYLMYMGILGLCRILSRSACGRRLFSVASHHRSDHGSLLPSSGQNSEHRLGINGTNDPVQGFADTGTSGAAISHAAVIYRRALFITALNPKGIIFFMAFLPLFIQPNTPLLPQFMMLALTFIAASTCSVVCYAWTASILRHQLMAWQILFDTLSALVFIAAGVMTLSLTFAA
jgi:threonine/homoserine/homoserine lactone efflux protein